MSGQPAGEQEEAPRKGSVKELIAQREAAAKKTKPGSAARKKTKKHQFKRLAEASRRLVGNTFRRKEAKLRPRKQVRKSVNDSFGAPSSSSLAVVDVSSLGPNSIQSKFPNVLDLHNKREKARSVYVQQQKQLRDDYEQKLKELHLSFADVEADLVSHFPVVDNSAVAEKAAKLESEAANEADESIAKKLRNEAARLRNEAKPQSELDFEKLQKIWVTVGSSQWDSITQKNYNHNAFRADVFEQIRRKQDHELRNDSGSRRKSGNGELAHWALNMLRNEEDNSKVLKKKQEGFIQNLTKQVVKFSNLEDNKENRRKAASVLTEMNFSICAAVTELRDPNVPMERSDQIKMQQEEENLERSVVLRAVGVDRESETIRFVMVLDRNGRPCVGGLPQEDVLPVSAFHGEEAKLNPIAEDGDEGIVEGYMSTEGDNVAARQYIFTISEFLSFKGIDVVDEEMQNLLKTKFNTSVPHITYQRISGFKVFNANLNDAPDNSRRRRDRNDDPGDFQLLDLGARLQLEPLLPLKDYEQEWRNGVLTGVKHVTDGPIRFVGFNETGFGFLEDRPIELCVQKQPGGLNIVHMTVFDTNDQLCFDTLYLNDDEDMNTTDKWKVFGKDAIGNRLAFRIVGQNSQVKAILYPFQGRVKRAKLIINDISEIADGDLVSVSVEGQTNARLGRVKLIPTGMILGQPMEAKNAKFPATPFLEMIRIGQRVMSDMPGLVDLELLCEDSQMLAEPRFESWPIECIKKASAEEIELLESLQEEQKQLHKSMHLGIAALISDVRNFVNDRTKRKERDVFLQEAGTLSAALNENEKFVEEGEELHSELQQAMSLLKRNIQAVERLQARQRKSKGRDEEIVKKKSGSRTGTVTEGNDGASEGRESIANKEL